MNRILASSVARTVVPSRGIKRLVGPIKKMNDPDGTFGKGRDQNMTGDRYLIRFDPETGYQRPDTERSVKYRTRIMGNGWTISHQPGFRKKNYRTKAVGGSEYSQYMKRPLNLSFTVNGLRQRKWSQNKVHKLSHPDYLRQRWTVSDPFKGYDDEAKMWHIPEDVPIVKHEADTHVKKFNLKAEKKMWPMKAPSGRKMKKHSRRSDTSMPGGSGKPNYNQHHDSNFINSVANKDHYIK